MKRNTMLKIVNPVLGVLVISQILTGLLAETLPPKAFEIPSSQQHSRVDQLQTLNRQ